MIKNDYVFLLTVIVIYILVVVISLAALNAFFADMFPTYYKKDC